MSEFINYFLNFLTDLGYFGVALALMVEVIPSEIALAYGGYLVSIGKINFFWTVIAGTIGGTLAQLFLYWLGLYGGRPFLEKYGKYILIKKKHIDIAEKWFIKYGPGVIFAARFIPVVRHAISIPAGIAKMSIWRFISYTTLAIIPWSILFIYMGIQLGNNWGQIEEFSRPFVRPVIYIMLIVTVLYIFYNRLNNKKGK